MSNFLQPTCGGDPPGGILLLMPCVSLSGCRRACSSKFFESFTMTSQLKAEDDGPSDEELIRSRAEALARVEGSISASLPQQRDPEGPSEDGGFVVLDAQRRGGALQDVAETTVEIGEQGPCDRIRQPPR